MYTKCIILNETICTKESVETVLMIINDIELSIVGLDIFLHILLFVKVHTI